MREYHWFPNEARRTNFEDVLGLTQEDLAGITIGFNNSFSKMEKRKIINLLWKSD